MSKKNKALKKIVPYLYISPIALILIVFVAGSVIISFVLGFTKYTIIAPPVFRGLDNYVRLFHDTKFLKCLNNTIKLMVYIVPLQMVTGVLISVFLVACRKRWLGKLANCVVFIPFLCSGVVCGVVWREFLNGKIPIVEKFFGLFGITPSTLLGDAKSVLIVVALVCIWKSMGYYTVIFSSGLLEISDSYYEAARVDGASEIRSFFSITLPLLKPTIILATFLSVTSSLCVMDIIMMMTGGGPNNASTTLVLYAYTLCFGSSNAGYAMAISNVLFLLIFMIAITQKRFLAKEASEI